MRRASFYTQLDSQRGKLNGVTGFEDEKIALSDKIDDLQRRLLRRVEIDDANVIKDLGVIEGSNLSDIALGENKIYVSDEGNGVIHEFDYAGGNMNRIAEGLSAPKTISVS